MASQPLTKDRFFGTKAFTCGIRSSVGDTVA